MFCGDDGPGRVVGRIGFIIIITNYDYYVIIVWV